MHDALWSCYEFSLIENRLWPKQKLKIHNAATELKNSLASVNLKLFYRYGSEVSSEAEVDFRWSEISAYPQRLFYLALNAIITSFRII